MAASPMLEDDWVACQCRENGCNERHTACIAKADSRGSQGLWEGMATRAAPYPSRTLSPSLDSMPLIWVVMAAALMAVLYTSNESGGLDITTSAWHSPDSCAAQLTIGMWLLTGPQLGPAR